MAAPDDDTAAVIAANQSFYRAFAGRDLPAMTALWAEGAPVACVHPGWPALVGREAVLESWRRILGNPAAPEVACRAEQVIMMDGIAVVLCEELIPGIRLTATNLFVSESGRWRMVHHHSSPMAGGAPTAQPERRDSTRRLH
jgi:ketosteroid isomerase-like protein